MGLHTRTTTGKRVIVQLLDGTLIQGRFVRRASNKRWIEVEPHGRIAMSQIKSFAVQKGELNFKRLGR